MPAHGTTSVNYTTNAVPKGTNNALKPGFKRMVLSDTVDVTWVAGGGSGNTTTSSVPHPLGYAPLVEAAINNANFTGSITLLDVNIPLPGPLSVNTSATTLGITLYMQVLVDTENVYFITFAANGAPGGTLAVTYYLYQQQVVQS